MSSPDLAFYPFGAYRIDSGYEKKSIKVFSGRKIAPIAGIAVGLMLGLGEAFVSGRSLVDTAVVTTFLTTAGGFLGEFVGGALSESLNLKPLTSLIQKGRERLRFFSNIKYTIGFTACSGLVALDSALLSDLYQQVLASGLNMDFTGFPAILPRLDPFITTVAGYYFGVGIDIARDIRRRIREPRAADLFEG